MLLIILIVLLVLAVSSGSRGFSRYGPAAIAPALFVGFVLSILFLRQFLSAR